MNTATTPVSQYRDVTGRPKQDNKALTADQRMRRAVARIEVSRSALIVCLAPNPPAPKGGTASFAETLAARIERNGLLQGGLRTVQTLVRRWWTRQPWHRSVDLIGQTLAHQARPLMRRHPMATLAVGASLGAVLVAAVAAVRPWALQHSLRQSGPWRDRMGSLLWTQFSSAPVQMALAGALAAWLADQRKHTTGSSGRTSDATPDGAQASATTSADKQGPV